MNNLVVFGPSHAGKSSLIGYLLASSMTNEEKEAHFRALTKELGHVEQTDKFRLLVDEHDDEKRRQKQPTHSTSRYMHTRHVTLGDIDVMLIDTPGREAESAKREMLRGLFYGDMGILLLDIRRFTNEKHLLADLSQIALWLTFGKTRRGLIVAIAKMDTEDFSDEAFESARAVCAQFLSDLAMDSPEWNSIPHHIIPIAIDFSADSDHNIIARSSAMPWYQGPTIREALATMAATVAKAPENERGPSLFCVRRPIYKPNAKPQGLIIEGKLMAGRLTTGARLKIVPVSVKGTWTVMTGSIAELRVMRTTVGVEDRQAGDLTSMNLVDLRISGRSAVLAEVAIPPSAVVTTVDSPASMANILTFQTDGRSYLKLLSLLRQVQLLWFGRVVQARVIAVDEELSQITLQLVSEYAGVVFATDGRPAHYEYVIRTDQGGGQGLEQLPYLAVTLVEASRVRAIRYTLPRGLSQEDLSEWIHGDYSQIGEEIVFDAPPNAIAILERISNFESAHEIDGEFTSRLLIVREPVERI